MEKSFFRDVAMLKRLLTPKFGANRFAGKIVAAAPATVPAYAVEAKRSIEVSDINGRVRDSIDGAEISRRKRRFSMAHVTFVLAVVVPTLLAAIYSLFWASDRYVCEFRVAVRSGESAVAPGIADLFGIRGMSQTGNDSSAVVQFLQSSEAFRQINDKFPIENKYSDSAIDWFSRFRGPHQIERLTRYWSSMVEAYYDASTGTIVARATAFSPDDALQIARLMLADSEALVNNMSERARRDAVNVAEQEVGAAEQRLVEVRNHAKALQDREKTLDPVKSAEVNVALAAKIKEQIAQLRAEIEAQKLRLSPQAPSVRAAQDTLSGLEQELSHLEAEATDDGASGSSRPLSSVFAAFQQLADERTFAEKAYLSSLTSLEAARAEARRQQVYLATIVPPGHPQEPAYPKPFRQISLTFILAAVLWAVGLLSVSAVREHI